MGISYGPEVRELALYAISDGLSFREAARICGVSAQAVSTWAAQEGIASPRRREQVYLPLEDKIEILRRLEAGERPDDLAAEAGVSSAAVYGWRRAYLEKGVEGVMTKRDRGSLSAPAAPEPTSGDEALRARVAELELQVAILEGTIDILKKDPGADPSALTAAERAALASELGPRFGLPALLRALSLPRSTYYYHLAAASAPDPYAALRPLVRDVFEASRGTYGSERVHAALASGEGVPQAARGAASLDPARPVTVSEKVVRRIMREEGLEPARPRAAAKYSSYRGEGGASAPNLLLVDASRDLHEFSAGAPWERLATDITEFRLPDDPRKVYLSPVVDLFDGKVVAFAAGTSPSKALVAEMLGRAVSLMPPGASPLLHSDRGWHYRTADWIAGCDAAGIGRSMSRKGHSPDNAACEGFFGRLKVEFFYGRDWSGWTAEAFIAELAAYISWHNGGRIKTFRRDGRAVCDTISGRRARLGLAA